MRAINKCSVNNLLLSGYTFVSNASVSGSSSKTFIRTAMYLSSKIAIAGVLIVIISCIIGFWGFWWLVTYNITKSVALVPDSQLRKAWERTPIPVNFNVYIFNVTNPWEVHNGSKPVLHEIGPFAFDEWKEKANVEDHNNNDTVSFNMMNTWVFNPMKSGRLTMDEIVVIPHMAMVGLVYMVEKRKPGSLRVIDRAVPALFNDPETIFLRTSVRDLLFDGNVINCTSLDFAPAAICTFIRAQAAGLHQGPENIFKFSLFGVKNGTPETGRFNVKRGIENYKEVGKVMLYNNEPQMYVWDGPECNKISGTDSTIFPALLNPTDEIVSFSPDICRSLGAKFQYQTEYRGISANRYSVTLGDMSSNPSEKCFCPTPETCLKKGAMDLTECQESPVVVTLPHFHDADPSYLETVVGLHPQAERHQIFLVFEPISGTPLSARKRLQFNIQLHAVKKVRIMASLPEAMLPVFWIEEVLDLEGEFLDILESSLFMPLRWVSIGRWVLISLGLLMIVASFVVRFYVKKNLKSTVLQLQTQPRPRPTQVEDLSSSTY